MFAQQFVRKLASQNSDSGGIDLEQLLLVMENDALAGAFEQRAELCFRFAQGALSLFALGIIYDAGTDQILAFRREAQEADFGRDERAIGSSVSPLENRCLPSQRLIHFFASEFARAWSIALKLRADVRGSQRDKFLNGHAIEARGVLVTEKESAGVAVKDDNGFGRVFDKGAEARFTGGEGSGAFCHALLQ